MWQSMAVKPYNVLYIGRKPRLRSSRTITGPPLDGVSRGRCYIRPTCTNMTAIDPQPVDAPLSRAATFLILTESQAPNAMDTIRDVISHVADMTKNVSIRHPSAAMSCTVGIGSSIWDRLTGLPKPAELHPFQAVRGPKHTAISTPGDLLFHIRSERRDVSFEFERQLMNRLGDSVKVEDETVGFRYFDARDLLGFVDGTANPVGPDISDTVLVNEGDDAAAAGGSYIILQKYVHDLHAWGSLSTEEQEAVIGRTKSDNIELEDALQGHQLAHKTLTTIEDDQGNEYSILRGNMPFGSPGAGEYGTYFVGYSRRLWVIEKMMERMFVGDPPGKYDRILDFSRPLTGTTFFAPPASVLENLGD